MSVCPYKAKLKQKLVIRTERLISLVSDSIVDKYNFVVVYKFAFDFSYQDHCNLLYSSITITLLFGSLYISIFGVRISIQYFCSNFSIEY